MARGGCLRRIRGLLSGAVLSLLLSAPAIAGLAVPEELAGLPLAHSQQGAEARAEIERLHGKSIAMRDGYVAHYGLQPPAAMLYVALARDEAAARQQVEQMTNRLRTSQATFTHLRESTRHGLRVYSTLGLGQVHYYFQRGAQVIWIAADPQVAQAALADAASKLR